MAGLSRGLKEGADVIVNTDADNQYDSTDIPNLVQPILDKEADYVIGERPINQIGHFPFGKKILQNIGSYVVKKVSGVDVADAPCGFRAMSRTCAIHMNVFNQFTYTLETLIQAGQNDIIVRSIPIGINPSLRPSRLMGSTSEYVGKSIVTILRIFAVYQPFKFFLWIGSILFTLGVIAGMRFLYYFWIGDGAGHLQSVVLSGIFMVIGFQTILVAFLADLHYVNRKLLEELVFQGRKKKYSRQFSNID